MLSRDVLNRVARALTASPLVVRVRHGLRGIVLEHCGERPHLVTGTYLSAPAGPITGKLRVLEHYLA